MLIAYNSAYRIKLHYVHSVYCSWLLAVLGSDEDDIDLFDSDAGEGSNDEEEQEEEEEEDNERSLYQYYDDFFDPVPSSVTKTSSMDQPLSLHQKKQEKVRQYILSYF